jgi:two-component system chemotaxis response regulator CheY
MQLNALVIDDSRVMRNMVIQSLNRTKLAEWVFVEASDGADALTKFNPEEIDICFVDWNMPNMTGIDFVKEVRSRGDNDHVPMVMVTSEKSMGKIEEALDSAGANAYICKPFTVEEMEAKLGKIVEEIEARATQSSSGGGLFGW